MVYKETYINLCHGTDDKSADSIIENGFELRGSEDSWCGKGIYFYDIKKKAWWSANRTCNKIKNDTGNRIKPAIIFADIIDLSDSDIIDLRTEKDLYAFEQYVNSIFGDYKIAIGSEMNDIERKIKLRSLMISFFVDKLHKKIVIGNFRQRPQPKYEHAIEFANSLDMIFGIETIYCVKDSTIIGNVRKGGEGNGENVN